MCHMSGVACQVFGVMCKVYVIDGAYPFQFHPIHIEPGQKQKILYTFSHSVHSGSDKTNFEAHYLRY